MPGYKYRGTDRDTEPRLGIPARTVPLRTTPAPAPAPKATAPKVPAAPAPSGPEPVSIDGQVFQWEDPPTPRSNRGPGSQIERLVTEMRKHPGRWLKVRTAQKGAGGAANWKKKGCEAVSRKDEKTGLFDTYARWPEAES